MASITSAEKVRALHAWRDVLCLPADALHLKLVRRCYFPAIGGNCRGAPLFAQGVTPCCPCPQEGVSWLRFRPQ